MLRSRGVFAVAVRRLRPLLVAGVAAVGLVGSVPIASANHRDEICFGDFALPQGTCEVALTVDLQAPATVDAFSTSYEVDVTVTNIDTEWLALGAGNVQVGRFIPATATTPPRVEPAVEIDSTLISGTQGPFLTPGQTYTVRKRLQTPTWPRTWDLTALVTARSAEPFDTEAGFSDTYQNDTEPLALTGGFTQGLSDAAARGGCGVSSLDPKAEYTEYRGEGVNTATGAQTEAMVDLDLPGVGTEIELVRCYNSNDAFVGPFGAGWSFTYSQRATETVAGDVNVRAEDGVVVQYTRNPDGSYNAPRGFRSRLVANAGGGWTLTDSDFSQVVFNAAGRPTSIKDRSGIGVTLAYTGARLTTVTDHSGRPLNLAYNAAGRIQSASLPGGRTVSYAYNAAGQLEQVTDLAGQAWTYAYDTAGRLASVTDPRSGVIFTSTYNAAGQVETQTDALGRPTTFTYVGARTTTLDPSGEQWIDTHVQNVLVEQIDPRGSRTQIGYSTELNPTRSNDATNGLTTTTFNAAGNPTTVRDPSGQTTSTVWDGQNNPTQTTDRTGAVTQTTYDSAGRPTQTTNALGHTTTMTYNALGQVTATTDEGGHTTTYGYDANGNQTSVTTPLGHTTTTTYDAAGRPVTVTDPRGKTTTTVYNARGQVTSVTDPLGNATTFTYDAAGNKATETNAAGNTTTYVYDAANRLTSVTDPRGGVSTFLYDLNGRLTSETRPSGATTTYTYDRAGNRASMTLPKGQATPAVGDYRWTYTYDDSGRMLTRRHPALGTWASEYDIQGRLTKETDPLGRITQTAYDPEGRPTSVTTPGGRTTTTTYDALSRVTKTTDPLERETTYGYDTRGNRVSETRPGGAVTIWTYDADGRLASTVDPRGNVILADPNDYRTTYTYDPAGNPTVETDPLGNQTTQTYDDAGRLTRRTDANGHATRYAYDPAGRLTSVTAPDAPTCATGPECVNGLKSTVYTLDANGNTVTRTDPNGNQTTMAYDAENRTTQTVSPIGQTWTQTYDLHSNVATKTTARGNAAANPATGRVTYTYDTADRNLRVIYGGTATPDVTFTYDALGRRTTMTDGTGTTTYTYNPAGEVTAVSHPTRGSFTYTYNQAGELTRRTRPDASTVDTTYDPDGRLATLTAAAGTWTFAHDVAGNLTQTTNPAPNDHTEKRTYDRAGRLTEVSNEQGATILSRHTQTLDPVGNPTTVATRRGATTTTDAFTYDPADRLTTYCQNTATCAGATDVTTWTHDPVGNRLTQTHTGGTQNPPTVTYTYNPADQLTQSVRTTPTGTATTVYTYDADGNQTRAGADRYTYDLENRMTSTDQGADITGYAYDGDGIRTSRSLNGALQQTYSWDTNGGLPELALERDAAGTALRQWVEGPAGPLWATEAGWEYFLHRDLIGSITDTTDGIGGRLWRYRYHPYGEQRAAVGPTSSAPTSPARFAGEVIDSESGQYHLRARQYDTASGRFTAEDPLGAAPSARALSTYAYAANNPTAFTDPSGLFDPGSRPPATAAPAGPRGKHWLKPVGIASRAGLVIYVGVQSYTFTDRLVTDYLDEIYEEATNRANTAQEGMQESWAMDAAFSATAVALQLSPAIRPPTRTDPVYARLRSEMRAMRRRLATPSDYDLHHIVNLKPWTGNIRRSQAILRRATIGLNDYRNVIALHRATGHRRPGMHSLVYHANVEHVISRRQATERLTRGRRAFLAAYETRVTSRLWQIKAALVTGVFPTLYLLPGARIRR